MSKLDGDFVESHLKMLSVAFSYKSILWIIYFLPVLNEPSPSSPDTYHLELSTRLCWLFRKLPQASSSACGEHIFIHWHKNCLWTDETVGIWCSHIYAMSIIKSHYIYVSVKVLSIYIEKHPQNAMKGQLLPLEDPWSLRVELLWVHDMKRLEWITPQTMRMTYCTKASWM